jgi:hypothetical protein
MTNPKNGSHKKHLPTCHTYNKDTPSVKKHRVPTSQDVVVGGLVSHSQPTSPPNTIISNGSSDASVVSLEAIINCLFISPSRHTRSPLADDAAVVEMASGGPMHSLNFGKSDLLQKQKNRLAKKVSLFKLNSNLVYPFL